VWCSSVRPRHHLRSDSAEQYPDRDFLVGHVVYDEPRFHVTSDYLTHYPTDERIVAVQNVNARLLLVDACRPAGRA
jgi:hypothetical protein